MRVAKSVGSCILTLAFCFLLLVGCRQQTTPSDADKALSQKHVSVAAAADLKFAFDELIGDFQQSYPNIKVQVTYGSSGNFFAQLANKAPFDIYFSADAAYPRQLAEKGLADQESLFLYAVGQIVVWVPNGSSIDVEQLGIQSVINPAARKVAIANPQHAPYGRAAEAAMKNLGVYEQVQDRLVLGENIAQTAQFVESGAADVGIIALSLALAPALRDKGDYWLIPMDAYPTMEQGSVILNWASDREATDLFRTFVAGPGGRKVLKQYGFIVPGE
jgi:molybdate transport system substrate-binding protein